MWVLFVIVSAVFLGIYDIFKKLSVRNNAVLPVLLISTLFGFTFFLPLIILSYKGIISENAALYVPFTGAKHIWYIFLKTCLVLSSWIFSYIALKHLPITIVSPIRATSPVFTLLGAMFFFSETYNIMQWLGIAIVFASIYSYSFIGKKEGIVFSKNIWILFIILATIFGASSGLYDKQLIVNEAIPRLEVQAWFSIFCPIILLPFVLIFWYPKRTEQKFSWRWSIPIIGVFLVLSDFVFFYALSLPGALIAIVSLVRRGSVVISFLSGLFLFKENNIALKSLALSGVILGIVLLYAAA